MKLIITGSANSGKTTVFNALTGLFLETTVYPTVISTDTQPHTGVVKIPDARVSRLSAIFEPKKTTHATVEYRDFPGITSGDVQQNAKVFNLIKDSDAIVHVVRAFHDESVMHPAGRIDPLRDIASFEDDLILGDLEFVEKRLEKIQEQAKRGKKPDEADRKVLEKCKTSLEAEISLSNVEFSDDERRLMLPYQFLTTIPEIIVLNIGEKDLNTEAADAVRLNAESYFRDKGTGAVPPVVTLCGKIEMEIAELAPDDSRAFLEDLGIEEPAMHKLCHVSYNVLGLISFFTVGPDEVKAWTLRRGTTAQQAAGKIHSDIERGFIRAETVSFDDFISSDSSMVTVKENGLVRLEGKTYQVQDGDIINFKFNV